MDSTRLFRGRNCNTKLEWMAFNYGNHGVSLMG